MTDTNFGDDFPEMRRRFGTPTPGTDYAAKAVELDEHLYGKPSIYTPPEDFMPRREAIAAKLAELFPDAKLADAVDDIVIRIEDLNANIDRLVEQGRSHHFAGGAL